MLQGRIKNSQTQLLTKEQDFSSTNQVERTEVCTALVKQDSSLKAKYEVK